MMRCERFNYDFGRRAQRLQKVVGALKGLVPGGRACLGELPVPHIVSSVCLSVRCFRVLALESVTFDSGSPLVEQCAACRLLLARTGGVVR